MGGVPGSIDEELSTIVDAMKPLSRLACTNLEKRLELNAARNHKKAPEQPQDLFKSAGPRQEPTHKALVTYLPQDEGMIEPQLAEMELRDTPTGPANERFQVSVPRNFPAAKPDANGDLVFSPDDPRFDSAHSFYIANKTLEMAQEYLGRELPWGFSGDLERNQMLIHPHAGSNTANAFYMSEAGSVNFFNFQDPTTNEVQRTGMSADIVAHETGHAVLDGLRHNYLSSLTVAAGGFHESFGDMMSILVALKDPAVLEQLQQETNGNLAIPNVVSKMAENLGTAAGKMDGMQTDCLRQALNDHKYMDQHFLPYVDARDPFSGLGQEPHAYSNLFTGAFYELLYGIHQVTQADQSKPFVESVGMARDIAGTLLFRATEFAPVGEPSYREIALAFLKADQVDFDGALRPVLEAVFKGRKILSDEDLANFDRHEASLPDLSMTPEVASEEGAMAFLEENREALGLNANLPFEFQETHANNRGETFVLYTYNQDVPLEGPDYGIMEGSKARMNGGLVLAFNEGGKLIAANHDDITDREINDVKDHLKTALGAGMLMAPGLTGTGNGNAAHNCSPGCGCGKGKFAPGYMQLNVISEGGAPVLRRSPVVAC